MAPKKRATKRPTGNLPKRRSASKAKRNPGKGNTASQQSSRTGAGRATHAGTSYQNRVSAWWAAVILAEACCQHAKIFVLTRYKDASFVAEGLEEETVAYLARSFAAKLQVDYKTMHSSKGLECDYVIIGGLDAGFRGFPSNFETNPLFELLLPPQSNAMDEERRLLYVAITRAKNTGGAPDCIGSTERILFGVV